MKKVVINGIALKIPTGWNELSAGQLEFLAGMENAGMKTEDMKTAFIVCCMKARLNKTADGMFVFIIKGKILKINMLQMEILKEELKWLTNDKGKLDLKLYRNPYPVMKIGKHTLRSSKERMKECVYEQFMYLMFYLRLMEEYKEYLPQVLACIWHTGKFFNPEKIHSDAVKIAALNNDKKRIMMWYVMSALKLMQRKFPNVFGGKGDTEENVYDQQMKIVNAMADGDVTKMEAVRKAPLYDALVAMEESIREAEDLNRKYKN